MIIIVIIFMINNTTKDSFFENINESNDSINNIINQDKDTKKVKGKGKNVIVKYGKIIAKRV